TLTFRNLGTAPALETQLVDTLPAGLAVLSASGGGIFDPGSNTLSFPLGTLAAHHGVSGGTDEGSGVVTAEGTAGGGSLTDTAVISTTTPESDLTNNASMVTTGAVSADVTVAVSGPAGSALTGSVITYTLNYRNQGTVAAEDTQLVDALPAG